MLALTTALILAIAHPSLADDRDENAFSLDREEIHDVITLAPLKGVQRAYLVELRTSEGLIQPFIGVYNPARGAALYYAGANLRDLDQGQVHAGDSIALLMKRARSDEDVFRVFWGALHVNHVQDGADKTSMITARFDGGQIVAEPESHGTTPTHFEVQWRNDGTPSACKSVADSDLGGLHVLREGAPGQPYSCEVIFDDVALDSHEAQRWEVLASGQEDGTYAIDVGGGYFGNKFTFRNESRIVKGQLAVTLITKERWTWDSFSRGWRIRAPSMVSMSNTGSKVDDILDSRLCTQREDGFHEACWRGRILDEADRYGSLALTRPVIPWFDSVSVVTYAVGEARGSDQVIHIVDLAGGVPADVGSVTLPQTAQVLAVGLDPESSSGGVALFREGGAPEGAATLEDADGRRTPCALPSDSRAFFVIRKYTSEWIVVTNAGVGRCGNDVSGPLLSDMTISDALLTDTLVALLLKESSRWSWLRVATGELGEFDEAVTIVPNVESDGGRTGNLQAGPAISLMAFWPREPRADPGEDAQELSSSDWSSARVREDGSLEEPVDITIPAEAGGEIVQVQDGILWYLHSDTVNRFGTTVSPVSWVRLDQTSAPPGRPSIVENRRYLNSQALGASTTNKLVAYPDRRGVIWWMSGDPLTSMPERDPPLAFIGLNAPLTRSYLHRGGPLASFDAPQPRRPVALEFVAEDASKDALFYFEPLFLLSSSPEINRSWPGWETGLMRTLGVSGASTLEHETVFYSGRGSSGFLLAVSTVVLGLLVIASGGGVIPLLRKARRAEVAADQSRRDAEDARTEAQRLLATMHPVGPPVEEEFWCVGLDEIREKVYLAFLDRGGGFTWSGPRRSGKTSLIRQLRIRLKRDGFHVVEIVCPHTSDLGTLRRHVFESCSRSLRGAAAGPCLGLAEFREEVIRAGARDLVLFFDETQELFQDAWAPALHHPMEQLRGWLRAELQSCSGVRYAFVGTELDFANAQKPLSLGSDLLNIAAGMDVLPGTLRSSEFRELLERSQRVARYVVDESVHEGIRAHFLGDATPMNAQRICREFVELARSRRNATGMEIVSLSWSDIAERFQPRRGQREPLVCHLCGQGVGQGRVRCSECDHEIMVSDKLLASDVPPVCPQCKAPGTLRRFAYCSTCDIHISFVPVEVDPHLPRLTITLEATS